MRRLIIALLAVLIGLASAWLLHLWQAEQRTDSARLSDAVEPRPTLPAVAETPVGLPLPAIQDSNPVRSEPSGAAAEAAGGHQQPTPALASEGEAPAPWQASVAPAAIQPGSRLETSPGTSLPGPGATEREDPVQALDDKMARFKDIQARMQALQAKPGALTPSAVGNLLQELIDVQGSSQMAGVNLQALRDNLRTIEKIDQAARELDAMTQPGGVPDVARVQALTEELQRLQGQIRSDIQVQP